MLLDSRWWGAQERLSRSGVISMTSPMRDRQSLFLITIIISIHLGQILKLLRTSVRMTHVPTARSLGREDDMQAAFSDIC